MSFKSDLKGAFNAFFYSMSGLRYLLRERAFKQELMVLRERLLTK